ncbi:MAG: hypothetical protein ACRC2R_17860 [Xenococcaceae cyanobacterium]
MTDYLNPFDKKLDLHKNDIPWNVRDELVWVHDTLDLCWASAKTIFGENVTPEIALAIYDRVVSRIQESEDSIDQKIEKLLDERGYSTINGDVED